MNNDVLVSIITVSYNADKTIEQTIKSVLNQTYKNIEYIIIDGKSTDNTTHIIEKYQNAISYYVSEKDNGIYNAMNKGIKVAHGKLIGIVNADDFYELDAVETMVAAYNASFDKDEAVYYGMLRIWKEEKEYCVRQYHHNFVTETVIQHPTCFVPKALYAKYGCFDESFKICGDFDLLNRFNANNVHFCKIDKVISNFRIGGATTQLAEKALLEPYIVKLRYGTISDIEFNRVKKYLHKREIKRNLKGLAKRILFWGK